MSFILDALKKSESDRQRKNQPDSAYVSSGGGSDQTSRWIWIVGVLLGLNIVVLLVVLMKPGGSANSTQPIAETPPVKQTERMEQPDAAGAEGDATFRDMVAEARRQQASTTPAGKDAGDVSRDRRSTPAAAIPLEPVATRSSQAAPAAAAADVSEPASAYSEYPTFDRLRGDGTLQLPDLRIDIHVYSEKPADRFVFVNMSKYKENATLSEGPKVAEIVPDGVVLEYLGTRFLLPRE